MTVLTLHAAGPAEPDEVWERYAQPARWPAWAPQVSRVETKAERIEAGVTGRVVGPLGVAVAFVVEAVDERARRWSWRVGVGPVRVRLEHGVRERSRGGTATWLTVDGPAPLVIGYAPVARLALRRLVAEPTIGD